MFSKFFKNKALIKKTAMSFEKTVCVNQIPSFRFPSSMLGFAHMYGDLLTSQSSYIRILYFPWNDFENYRHTNANF